MSIERAKEEIANYNRKLRMIDIEIDRMKQIRENFERERDMRQSFIDLYPVYIDTLADTVALIRGDISGSAQRDGILKEADAILEQSK